MASQPSSVALAVQHWQHKAERLEKLIQDIQTLARGDVAHDMYVPGLASAKHAPTPTAGEANDEMAEDHKVVYTEADVKNKLKDFQIDPAHVDAEAATSLLSLCLLRCEDRQCYEKSKLAKAEADKLGNLARSMNPEVCQPVFHDDIIHDTY